MLSTEEYEHAKAMKRVYHFEPDTLPEGAPSSAKAGNLCEYRDCVIEKSGYGVRFLRIRDGAKLPYAAKPMLERLKLSLWQMPALVKEIDKALDEPRRKQ